MSAGTQEESWIDTVESRLSPRLAFHLRNVHARRQRGKRCQRRGSWRCCACAEVQYGAAGGGWTN